MVHFSKYLDSPFFIGCLYFGTEMKINMLFGQKKAITDGPNYRWGKWTVKLFPLIVNDQQVIAGDLFHLIAWRSNSLGFDSANATMSYFSFILEAWFVVVHFMYQPKYRWILKWTASHYHSKWIEGPFLLLLYFWY